LLAFSDQRLKVGFESGPVLGRMLQQQFDQPPLTGAEVAMNATARQPVEESDRLLREEFFEFVGRHRLTCDV